MTTLNPTDATIKALFWLFQCRPIGFSVEHWAVSTQTYAFLWKLVSRLWSFWIYFHLSCMKTPWSWVWRKIGKLSVMNFVVNSRYLFLAKAVTAQKVAVYDAERSPCDGRVQMSTTNMQFTSVSLNLWTILLPVSSFLTSLPKMYSRDNYYRLHYTYKS